MNTNKNCGHGHPFLKSATECGVSTTNDGGPAFPAWELNGQGQQEMTCFGMTLRQYAAIKLRVPNSGTDWLDDMIQTSQRDELAGKAMQWVLAYLPKTCYGLDWQQKVAHSAFELANEMLKAQ